MASEARMRRWTAGAVAAQQAVRRQARRQGHRDRAGVDLRPRGQRLLGPARPPRIASLLERDPDVRGVYPVRAAYPASLSSRALARSGAALAAGTAARHLRRHRHHGRGARHRDRRHAPVPPRALARRRRHRRARGHAAPGQHPTLPGQVERHGTQLAGIVVGSRGPGGLTGTAPGARILPIRVAGWQPDAAGGYAVYGRTDQLLAGLERAVDPNADGSATGRRADRARRRGRAVRGLRDAARSPRR